MKILMIVTTNFDNSGITNNLMKYYKYLDKSEFDIDFLIPNTPPAYIEKIVNDCGNRIFTINRNKPLSYFIKTIKLVKNGKYDIAHIHGNSSTILLDLLATKFGGIKNRIAHSRNTYCKYHLLHKILKPLFYRAYTHSFACGVDAGKWLFGNRYFTVIKNGNDVERFKFQNVFRENIRKELNLVDKLVLGHIGAFNDQKNHDFLINMFIEVSKERQNCVLILVGIGEKTEHIKNMVNKANIGDKVIFLGKVLEIEKIYSAIDLFVLPSKYEGFPNVIIEAQISGVPVILSDTVTRDVNITGTVTFLSISKNTHEWSDYILNFRCVNREEQSRINISKIISEGYDIRTNAKFLEKKYLEIGLLDKYE